ncbi:hypothetical protein SSX86_031612, partial [Deinandra increscens subsp. villosa]
MAIEIHNILIFFSTILASLSYSYFISSNLPSGIYKLISLLPIFYLFTILPLLLSSAITTAITAFFFTWIANFKLVLFAFNRPPLHPTKSLTRFIAIASLPFKIESSNSFKSDPKRPPLNVTITIAIESFVLPLLINYVYNHRRDMNPHILLIIYCFLIFLFVDLLVFVSSFVIFTVTGVDIEPPSDEPYLATSLQNFWGRRWNLTVTNTLRHTVYKPVKSFFSGNEWDWVPAVITTFFVSGLMHELLLYHVTKGVSPTWEMTSFFGLHGACVVVEVAVKRAVAGKLEFPVAVSRVLTVGFVVV